jgi:microcystin-dependent protein
MFLLAAGATYGPGTTGGEATHTLTVDEIPAHTHSYSVGATNSNHSGGDGYHYLAQNNSATTGSTGGGLAHNNMPPYIAVYV